MSPARRTLVAKPPQHLSPTRISNSTQLDMAVTAFPVLLVQQLDGSFDFHEDARDLNAARLMFPIKPQKFVLKPDSEKFLDLRWQLLPRKAKAGYFGLVVQGVPTAKGKGVGSVLRLLGINFFTLPGKWKVDGRLTGLRGEQAAPRVLRFFPRVRNTGQIHSAPLRAKCVISGGGVRLSLPYGKGVVLPGYEREYPVLVQKPHVLPAGSYSMKCSQIFGKRRTSDVLRFKLSGPNTLPTASLKLQAVSASGEIDGKASVHATAVCPLPVRNAVPKGAEAVVKLRIDRLPAGSEPVLVAGGSFPQGSIKAQ